MVQKLEAIKGGGGSIRVGTTGTIGALMTREMESIKPSTQASASASGQGKPRTIPVSVPCSATTPRKLQPRKSLDEASSSGCRSGIGHRSPETPRKVKSFNKSTHRMPMLGSESSTLDRTPSREKPDKKAIHIVEIVDIKCGNPERAWANPITSKLKKLVEEATVVIWGWGFFELSRQPNSSWLKYLISCIMRDPTVPLVPICTGFCAAISWETLVAMSHNRVISEIMIGDSTRLSAKQSHNRVISEIMIGDSTRLSAKQLHNRVISEIMIGNSTRLSAKHLHNRVISEIMNGNSTRLSVNSCITGSLQAIQNPAIQLSSLVPVKMIT
ncbi:hypothetical protein OIU79_026428 [Salix purpurea]|uniref:Uncharacterized protein n=1 Tax=Salix purpurea TaxID=77065 RepID=A0A9Q0VTU9_SALPP|nr:hypothetical protein OIU79_026428 [Salix purpurea]